MNKRNFKVGELYRVGLDCFGRKTKETGNIIKIKEISCIGGKELILYQTIKLANESKPTKELYCNRFANRSQFADGLKKISSDTDREIQITFHGKTTVAKLKEYGKVVKVGVSKCCPDDTYKEYIGAGYALARIFFPEFKMNDNNETNENKEEKSNCKWCDKQFSHSDINKVIYNLINRYDIADTWLAESLYNFGTALHEELENTNTR